MDSSTARTYHEFIQQSSQIKIDVQPTINSETATFSSTHTLYARADLPYSNCRNMLIIPTKPILFKYANLMDTRHVVNLPTNQCKLNCINKQHEHKFYTIFQNPFNITSRRNLPIRHVLTNCTPVHNNNNQALAMKILKAQRLNKHNTNLKSIVMGKNIAIHAKPQPIKAFSIRRGSQPITLNDDLHRATTVRGKDRSRAQSSNGARLKAIDCDISPWTFE